MTGTPARFAQTSSCSFAAARKVSAAAITTLGGEFSDGGGLPCTVHPHDHHHERAKATWDGKGIVNRTVAGDREFRDFVAEERVQFRTVFIAVFLHSFPDVPDHGLRGLHTHVCAEKYFLELVEDVVVDFRPGGDHSFNLAEERFARPGEAFPEAVEFQFIEKAHGRWSGRNS
jgi:hypothetical protein